MKRPVMPFLFCCIVVMALCKAAFAAPLTDRIAELQVSGGVACFIDPSDLTNPSELAKQGRFLVYVAISDEARVADFRSRAAAEGLLGRSLYVDYLRDRVALPDHFADVVVAAEGANEAEALRVAAPIRGVVFLGDRTLTKPPLKGADDWSHRLHGTDNNPVSADTAFHGSPLLQYVVMPQQTSFQGGMLVAGGRRLELSDWVTKKPDRNAVAGMLRVRSLYNGRQLWERKLPENIEPDMPICAITGDRVVLADDQACRVSVFDAETGAEREPISFGTDDRLRVVWLAVEGNRLYALVGKSPSTRARLEFMSRRGNREIRLDQAFAGEGLAAWDLDRGRMLWRHEESSTIDYRTVAVRDGRTYFYSEGTRLACLDGDGRLAWENRDEAWLIGLKRPSFIRNINHESSATLIVGPSGQLRLALAGGPDGYIFDAATGKLLWQDKLAAPKCMFLGDRYLCPSGEFDAATGAKLGESRMPVLGSGCGIVTWVPSLEAGLSHVAMGVKSPCGVGTFAAGGLLHFAPSQCDCWPHVRGGAAFASGDELFEAARMNPNHPLVRGAAFRRAATTAAAHPGEWPQYRGDVLRRGAAAIATDAAPKLRAVACLDAPLPVPTGHDMHRDEWLDRATPPVTAGGRSFYGTSDGAVRAVVVRTGEVAWTYLTGGAVLTAPAFAEGRLFVGSGDGWVYCLDAADGALIWKWRGAPLEHRTNVYDKLLSAWPVLTVMPHDRTVFGIAGLWMQNGSVAFALDASTGEPRWTRWTEPHYDATNLFERDEHGFGPCGYAAVVGPNVWFRTHLGIPAVFNAQSGERVLPADDYRKLAQDGWNLGFRTAGAGQDIGVLDDHTVLQGGYPVLGNTDMRHDKSAAKYVAWMTDDAGRVTSKPLPQLAVPHSQIAPALHDGAALVVGGVGKDGRSANSTIGISLWSTDAWRTAYTATPAGKSAADNDEAADPAAARRRLSPAEQAVFNEIRNFVFSLDMTKAAWRHDQLDVNAAVLTPDAAIVVHGTRTSWGRAIEHPGFTGWRLTAFDRATGAERWTVDLPGEPVFNGLAPAGGGSWVVTMRDGGLAVVGAE